MVTHDIVVVGASAGGVKALRTLVAGLPADYSGAVFVVLHLRAGIPSELARILARSGPLPAVAAADEMPIEHGRIYVAPPDLHLLLERNRVRVIFGPRENRHRPAVDPLFRSAAWAYGPRAVAVVLTGGLDDGTAGLWAIKSCGGIAIVQEPDDAEHPEMPMNALLHNKVDHRVPLAEIAPLLVQLANSPLDTEPPRAIPLSLGEGLDAVKMEDDMESTQRVGTLSPFTCPSCRGALWEMEEGGHLRYRCHTGHAYSQQSLVADQAVAVEESLYAALRAVEEKGTCLRRLASRWPEAMPGGTKRDYENRAQQLDIAAGTLKDILASAKR